MAEDDFEGELKGWIREEESDYVKGIVRSTLNNWAEVQDSLDDYNVEDVFLHLPEQFKEEHDNFREIQKTLDRNMRDRINLLRDNPENNQAVVKLESFKGKFKQKIKTHVNQLRAKMNQLKDASVESVQGDPVGNEEENVPAPAQNHNAAVLRAGVKGEAVRADVTALTEDLTYVDVYLWEEVSDVEIAKAMRKIKPWREELNRIVKSWRDLKEMATVAGIQNRPEVHETGQSVKELQALFQQVVTEVEKEDLSRCLHSLDVSTGAKVSYPNFEGRDDEDWNDFEEKLTKALNDNKVRASDKCEKLRSCLRGHARKLVPDHQKDYVAAMSALEKAFGDGNRLLNHKIDALNKLGPCPKNSDKKTGGRTTVEWYLNLETILNSLLDLGRKTDDEDIRVSVYSKKIVETVALLFPQITGMQILDCKGTGEIRMKNVVEKVEELRGAAQRWGLASGGDAAAGAQTSKPAGDGGNNGRNGGGGGFNNRRSGNVSGNVKAHVSYNPPVNLPDCRICRALEDRGDTRQLYDEHHSNYPTGCPRFIAMSTEERRKISMEAKLCLRCLDPSYKFAGLNDGRHKCLDFYNKKSRYTCPENNCKSHVWTCTRHRDNNTAVFEKFRTEIKNKTGLGFCYFIGALPFPVTQEENRGRRRSVAGNARSLRVTGATTGAVETSTGATETSTGATETSIRATESSVGATGSVTAATPQSVHSNDCPSPPTESQSAHKTQEPPRLSSSQALSLLKKKMKGKRIRAKFRPIEKGAPQFMLGYSKGKTRPLVTLYDTGCSTVLFKEGVPNVELGPAVEKMKGPLFVNGVGDTSVKVNSEYMCSIQLVDGTRSILEGVTVDRISSPIPYAKLGAAEKQIKDSDLENADLQSLQCNPEVGGEIDILMGIFYAALFPTPVHSLPSGLTIYRLTVSSYDSKYNAVIGGPHESFAGMANHFRGLGLNFFAHLQEQLEDYRQFGPPNVSKALMSLEDREFAAKFGETGLKVDVESFGQDDSLASDGGDEDWLETQLERSVLNVVIDCLDISEVMGKISCQDCGDFLNSSLVSVNEDEDARNLRMIRKAQDEGLSIEYRCPKCRNCQDCRNSHNTERISLREEAEDLMIRDSVTLDWANKRIISHLPMRGKPEEFLTNNRDIALKILQQQSVKYFNDEDTKEIVIGAFQKLLKNGQMILWDDVSQEDKDLILSKAVNHYIVWRVVFKASLSSPARIVFDASSNTRPGPNGSGGRCLNDLVVKGKVTTLNLTKMVLRFTIGQFALQGDLRQFYASIKLIKDHWCLQRVLFKPDLDPNTPPVEALISTLIWGIRCVSAQSEAAVDKIALSVRELNPRLAELLADGRFVDDLGDSDVTMENIENLIKDANEIFEKVGLSCKGWSVSGRDPPPEVCEEGGNVSIGGMKWQTATDSLEIPIPTLHFSKKNRGRLVIGTEVFDGKTLEDLDKFVPTRLTRRMVVSKKASLFDLLGKLTPISARLSLDLRTVMKETEDWDDCVSSALRMRWVQNFLLLEQLKGIKFARARMPEDAVSAEMDLIIAGDTAKEFVKICGVWGRFKLRNGSYSNQHLIGRSLLGDEDSSVPKEELESLTMCSNLGWIVRQMLEKWVKDYIVISDSTISLCWVLSEKKKLSLFHRNRSVQVRRGTDLEKLYHCRSEFNPCDLGTRTNNVSVSDVGPNSSWELGLPWMTESVEEAVKIGILTPATDLTMSGEEAEEFDQGFVFEKTPEVLTRGHVVLHSKKVDCVRERLEFSNYVVDPLKFTFDKTVRIIALVHRYIRNHNCMKNKLIVTKESTNKFQMFKAITGFSSEGNTGPDGEDSETGRKPQLIACPGDSSKIIHPPEDVSLEELRAAMPKYRQNITVTVATGIKNPGPKFKGDYHIVLRDREISKALEYLFTKASAEVKEFNKSEFVKKIAVEKDGILYSKSRIIDGQRLQVAAGLESLEFLSSFKPFRTGFNLVCPVIDRFSPLGISIAEYVHAELADHRGFESCYRASLDFCFIIQGLSLFREIGEDCIKCKKIRTKYLDVSMGPLPDESFIISPPFYACQIDIMGPLHVYVPGHSMALRNRKILEAKCYALVSVCMTTKCVNIQVIESKSADGIIDGINRLACEVGVPKIVIMDKDTGIIKALTECEVRLKDIQLYLYNEKGIKFRTIPVAGHNMTGLVERKIKSVQECMERMEVDKMRLHATGYQTLFKLMENDLNNLPFGFGYGRKDDNSPILKLIYPNLLRLGRNNSRSLDNIIKLPKTPNELMDKIERAYKTFYELWNTVLIPKMMKASKWYNEKEVVIIPGDIVYFQKVENELSSKWTVGKVTDVTFGKDGKARRATVLYQNSNEDFAVKRTTERAVRSLVKLFNVDEKLWTKELYEVEEIINNIEKEELGDSSIENEDMLETSEQQDGDDENNSVNNSSIMDPHKIGAKLKLFTRDKNDQRKCKSCCCQYHCMLVEAHGRSGKKLDLDNLECAGEICEDEFDGVTDRSWDEREEYEQMLDFTIPADNLDTDLTALISAVNVELDTPSESTEPLHQWSSAV